MIEVGIADVPLTAQADILSLSRSSLYYTPSPPSAHEVAAKHRIDELYLEFPYYGARRMAAQLRREGQALDRKTVRKYMQEMGLIALYPGPNLSKRHSEHRVFPYLLRDVTPSAPDHVWGMDITFIRLRQGWMYLVAVLDWYSRYIVSWAFDDTLEIGFVLDAARQALARATPQIWNTDQGSQFTTEHNVQKLGRKVGLNEALRAGESLTFSCAALGFVPPSPASLSIACPHRIPHATILLSAVVLTIGGCHDPVTPADDRGHAAAWLLARDPAGLSPGRCAVGTVCTQITRPDH
jgi:putative transposase